MLKSTLDMQWWMCRASVNLQWECRARDQRHAWSPEHTPLPHLHITQLGLSTAPSCHTITSPTRHTTGSVDGTKLSHHHVTYTSHNWLYPWHQVVSQTSTTNVLLLSMWNSFFSPRQSNKLYQRTSKFYHRLYLLQELYQAVTFSIWTNTKIQLWIRIMTTTWKQKFKIQLLLITELSALTKISRLFWCRHTYNHRDLSLCFSHSIKTHFYNFASLSWFYWLRNKVLGQFSYERTPYIFISTVSI